MGNRNENICGNWQCLAVQDCEPVFSFYGSYGLLMMINRQAYCLVYWKNCCEFVLLWPKCKPHKFLLFFLIVSSHPPFHHNPTHLNTLYSVITPSLLWSMFDKDSEKPIAQQQEESMYLIRSVRVGTTGDPPRKSGFISLNPLPAE